ncbi:MAG: deoxyguanosine kinase [Deltaproteobacteria bacterium RIFCSPLOWO2_02_FULL_44_10]|nr:MAG: deoxyguanosine kinase [Deltaproteobacteria bacterium RIFCSPHIGHO2_02_FULL_44_16]OGQ46977.1 MAG: deoxyguanosine kinase [Deltaproteobacteria bacterium RIFCSPLOWO2_02_FULL_44_10]
MSKYIAIAGNIGSGKSSMVDFLCNQFGLKPFFEQNDANPYFPLFYNDMKHWAFHFEMFFLIQKFKMHREIAASPESVILDRTIFEDAEVFTENLYRQGSMSKEDYQTYRTLYETIAETIAPPKILIYLECPVRALKKRIAKRGRVEEKSIPDEYLKRLHQLYTKWIDHYDKSPVIRFSTEKIDYLEDFIHRQDLLQVIQKHL